MGQTPAKTFNYPTPFGGSPQTNNVQQAQPLTQVQGPGFAATGAFDQTQQQPQVPAPSSAQLPGQFPGQSMFGGGGFGVKKLQSLGNDANPFAGTFQL
jgi:hypothetical protein